MTEHEWWDHEMMVGQRTAVQVLESKLKEIVKQRRIDYVDAQPWTGMRPCCVEYVAHLDHLNIEWAEEVRMYRDGTHPLIEFRKTGEGLQDLTPEEHAQIYEKCIADNVPIREQVTTGTYTAMGKRQCCPWDDRLADRMLASYRTLMGYFDAGGKYEDLTFGPIEVIKD